jgi:hypothetical protein
LLALFGDLLDGGQLQVVDGAGQRAHDGSHSTLCWLVHDAAILIDGRDAADPRIADVTSKGRGGMKRLFVVALTVLGLCVAAQSVPLQAQAKPKSMSATGVVKSVSATSLAITASGNKEMTFTVDGTTKFVGKGLSTKSREKGGKITAMDAVGDGDSVSVTYHDMGGTMHAAQVRVNNKAMATKK